MVCMSSSLTSSWWGPPDREVQTNEKPRSPSWCRGPWSLRSLEAPVRRRTRRQSPRARASRQGRQSFFFESSRRCGGSYAEPYAYSRLHATIYVAGLVGASRRRGGTHRRCPRLPAPGSPGPLDNLPRPLAERERRPRRGRRRIACCARRRSRCRRGRSSSARADVLASRPAAESARSPGVVATPGPTPCRSVRRGAVDRRDPAADWSRRTGPERRADTAIDRPRRRERIGPRPPRASTPDRLSLAAAARPPDAAVRPDRRGARASSTASCSTTASTSRRSAATGSSRRTTASVLAAGRHFDGEMGWVGDLEPYFAPPRQEAALDHAADRRRHRRRQRLSQHLRPLQQGRGQEAARRVKAGQFLGYEGMTGRASGCHVHYGLFSPLETATFGIEADVVKRMKVPEPPDRPDRSARCVAARPRRASRALDRARPGPTSRSRPDQPVGGRAGSAAR